MSESNEVKDVLKSTKWLLVLWSFGVLVLLSVLLSLAGCDGVTIGEDPPACYPGQCDQACPGGQCPDNAGWPKELQPCDESANPYRGVPPVDLPKSLRQANYGGGSCMYAALIPVLRWQGRYQDAEKIRKQYSGAQGVDGLAPICDSMGLRFAYTVDGDANFLEWCSRTRRGAAIHYYTQHAVTFCGYDDKNRAVLLNNNSIDRYAYVPKAEFVSAWHVYGGRALTVVYAPMPPKPWVPVTKRLSYTKVDAKQVVYQRTWPHRTVIFTRPYRPILVPRPLPPQPRPIRPRPIHVDIRW